MIYEWEITLANQDPTDHWDSKSRTSVFLAPSARDALDMAEINVVNRSTYYCRETHKYLPKYKITYIKLKDVE